LYPGIAPVNSSADIPAMTDGRYFCQHAVRTSCFSAG
jgi:hypothetical protein